MRDDRTDRHESEEVSLTWDHGELTLQTLGAMLAPLQFRLPDGREVQPMSIAPWAEEKSAPGQPSLSGVMRRLRGEFPCVPYGHADPVDDLAPAWTVGFSSEPEGPEHGPGANSTWTVVEHSRQRLILKVDYPVDHPVTGLRRVVTPDPSAPAVDLELTIDVRRDCRLPIGLHPILALPPRSSSARILPGKFQFGATYPGRVPGCRSMLVADRRFDALEAVPSRRGDTVDLSAVPLVEPVEEVVMLCVAEGVARLEYVDAGYAFRLDWDAAVLPNLLLWYTNGGAQHPPWNGRYVALGMEPVASAFGLAPSLSARANPLVREGARTAITLRAGTSWKIRYRMSLEPLNRDD